MISGYRNGLQETWNENGQLIVCINFKSGVPCCISKVYYDTGELKSETNFIEFVPNSVSGSASELLSQLNIKKSHIIVKNYLQN